MADSSSHPPPYAVTLPPAVKLTDCPHCAQPYQAINPAYLSALRRLMHTTQAAIGRESHPPVTRQFVNQVESGQTACPRALYNSYVRLYDAWRRARGTEAYLSTAPDTIPYVKRLGVPPLSKAAAQHIANVLAAAPAASPTAPPAPPATTPLPAPPAGVPQVVIERLAFPGTTDAI